MTGRIRATVRPLKSWRSADPQPAVRRNVDRSAKARARVDLPCWRSRRSMQ